jgi:hypothetical protein
MSTRDRNKNVSGDYSTAGAWGWKLYRHLLSDCLENAGYIAKPIDFHGLLRDSFTLFLFSCYIILIEITITANTSGLRWKPSQCPHLLTAPGHNVTMNITSSFCNRDSHGDASTCPGEPEFNVRVCHTHVSTNACTCEGEGRAVAQLVQELRYKSEGRGFFSRYHWIIQLT